MTAKPARKLTRRPPPALTGVKMRCQCDARVLYLPATGDRLDVECPKCGRIYRVIDADYSPPPAEGVYRARFDIEVDWQPGPLATPTVDALDEGTDADA